ncbi:hypothetical protein BESB_013060 [Besnoitia besnoiti]|uniref:Uncharacterized protein n=1 Tax=Besnoitia besnoiti TaxID=94643 RepID=A0A2A9M679_BESBE|nr:hypothetical protein BESB_013060 [Besnoitia besnoiti]PFH32694.1 hypothetical protein BESB_013060 [Besnoitia besnoiti]
MRRRDYEDKRYSMASTVVLLFSPASVAIARVLAPPQVHSPETAVLYRRTGETGVKTAAALTGKQQDQEPTILYDAEQQQQQPYMQASGLRQYGFTSLAADHAYNVTATQGAI